MLKLVLIDNYDSFTFNLVHYFGELGADVAVHRNDQITVNEVVSLQPDAIVLSPGPCTPDEAGICLEMIGEAANHRMPLLGVCLGHQAIGQFFGGKVVRAPLPVHGKLAEMKHGESGLFKNLGNPFQATRYHSLIVERPTLPECLSVTAALDDGMIMGLSHTSLPIHGVQFHPESILSEQGHDLLQNFLDLAAENSKTPA